VCIASCVCAALTFATATHADSSHRTKRNEQPAASPNTLVVLVTVAGTHSVRSEFLQSFVARLSSLAGPVMSIGQALDAVTANISRAPHLVNTSFETRVRACDEKHLGALYASTVRSNNKPIFQDCFEPAQDHLEWISRVAPVGQAVFDACLHQVGLWLKAKKEAEATMQAFECRRLVPNGVATEDMHEPQVIGHVAAADAELKKLATPDLRVEADKNGCSVYVNGVHRGTTPLALKKLPPGKHAVQVQCASDSPSGARGDSEYTQAIRAHVHEVELPPAGDPIVLHVDTRFDSVFSAYGPSLTYPSEQERTVHALLDALYIAKRLRMPQLWMLTPTSASQVRADKVDIQDNRILASVWLKNAELPSSDESIEFYVIKNAVDNNQSAEVVQPKVAAPRSAWSYSAQSLSAAENTTVEFTNPTTPRVTPGAATTPPTPLGWILAGAGVTALGMATALQLRWNAESSNDPEPVGYAALALGGGAALSVGLPFFLPDKNGIPWWTWLTAAAGTYLAVAGVYSVLTDGDCVGVYDQNGICSEEVVGRNMGIIQIAAGLPLMSIPLIYALRGTRDTPDTRAPATRAGWSLHLTGTGVGLRALW
jgi:hypothetical protein